jgi:hypothetical protein
MLTGNVMLLVDDRDVWVCFHEQPDDATILHLEQHGFCLTGSDEGNWQWNSPYTPECHHAAEAIVRSQLRDYRMTENDYQTRIGLIDRLANEVRDGMRNLSWRTIYSPIISLKATLDALAQARQEVEQQWQAQLDALAQARREFEQERQVPHNPTPPE